jgi:hypothetical protein
MSKRIVIFPGISVYASDEMLQMFQLIEDNAELKLDFVTAPQKKLLKEMHERNLLVRRRKNNEVSYSIRPGISWK